MTIRDLRITTRQIPGQFRRSFENYSKLAAESASEVQTVNNNGVEMETTVENYFKDTYNIRLHYPMLRCVIGEGKILPLELCSVVKGQRCTKLNEGQRLEMSEFTCLRPMDNANKVREDLRILSYDKNEYVEDFGIKVSSEMVTLWGRVLPAPTIQYHPSSCDYSFVPRNET